jgi:hypothetical protein
MNVANDAPFAGISLPTRRGRDGRSSRRRRRRRRHPRSEAAARQAANEHFAQTVAGRLWCAAAQRAWRPGMPAPSSTSRRARARRCQRPSPPAAAHHVPPATLGEPPAGTRGADTWRCRVSARSPRRWPRWCPPLRRTCRLRLYPRRRSGPGRPARVVPRMLPACCRRSAAWPSSGLGAAGAAGGAAVGAASRPRTKRSGGSIWTGAIVAVSPPAVSGRDGHRRCEAGIAMGGARPGGGARTSDLDEAGSRPRRPNRAIPSTSTAWRARGRHPAIAFNQQIEQNWASARRVR